jgi:hypothetical protein
MPTGRFPPPADRLWVCSCGQPYRMADTRAGTRFWPSTGAAAYSRHGLAARSPCIRCGDRIRGKKPMLSTVGQRRSDPSLAPEPTRTDGDADAIRAAEHQSLFREVNERIEALNQEFSRILAIGDWICECADEECFEPIALTLAEYEAIRRHPARFPVLPGHELPEVETVVEANDRYLVVEKNGPAATVAAQHDPRRARTRST